MFPKKLAIILPVVVAGVAAVGYFKGDVSSDEVMQKVSAVFSGENAAETQDETGSMLETAPLDDVVAEAEVQAEEGTVIINAQDGSSSYTIEEKTSDVVEGVADDAAAAISAVESEAKEGIVTIRENAKEVMDSAAETVGQ